MHINFPNKIKIFITAVIAVLCIVMPGFSAAADNSKSANGQSTILIIASYNPDTQRMSEFISEFQHALIKDNVPYNIIVEDMGCRGISEAPLWRRNIREILKKYENADLKAVVLLGQEAWASFISEHYIPRKDIPFFVCFASSNGILLPADPDFNETDWKPEMVDMVQLAKDMGVSGGYLNQYDIDKNIELVQHLYPNTNNIAFITDNSYGGISLKALFEKESEKYKDINFIYIDTREANDDISELIAELPQNTVILLGTWRVGNDGQYLIYNSLDKMIDKNNDIPIFSVSGAGIGNIAIGGYIPRYGNGGAEIAEQIVNYYKGKNVISFKLTSGEYLFDSNKLKAFGIDQYKLPTKSVVIDNLQEELRKYKQYITIFIVAFIGLALLFLIIYYMYYRNKKLQAVLIKREGELIIAKEKAEESDRLKSAFLANMSHEIRTPLNAIIGFSSLLGSAELPQDERAQYSEVISKNSDLLLTLINDILDISRLETDKVNFTYTNEDVCGICQQVMATITSHNKKKDVEYIFKSSQPSYIMATDAKRLSQVLINLLTNANKFTERGSIILEADIREDDKLVRFSVSDTGCGIPTELQAKIFNRFEKLNEFKQGTGLGLSICQHIAVKFGGKIWVDPGYTGGARFIFEIPIVDKIGEDI